MITAVEELFNQVLIAAEGGAFYLALLGALVIPDVCAGLESKDGMTDRTRYRDWFDRWVAPKYVAIAGAEPTFTGQDAYHFRCSMLHLGNTQHDKGRYSRILFVPRGQSGNVFHNNVLNDALNLDIPIFCQDVVSGAMRWQQTVGDFEPYLTNLDKFLRIYPDGLAPYFVGSPVIS